MNVRLASTSEEIDSETIVAVEMEPYNYWRKVCRSLGTAAISEFYKVSCLLRQVTASRSSDVQLKAEIQADLSVLLRAKECLDSHFHEPAADTAGDAAAHSNKVIHCISSQRLFTCFCHFICQINLSNMWKSLVLAELFACDSIVNECVVYAHRLLARSRCLCQRCQLSPVVHDSELNYNAFDDSEFVCETSETVAKKFSEYIYYCGQCIRSSMIVPTNAVESTAPLRKSVVSHSGDAETNSTSSDRAQEGAEVVGTPIARRSLPATPHPHPREVRINAEMQTPSLSSSSSSAAVTATSTTGKLSLKDMQTSTAVDNGRVQWQHHVLSATQTSPLVAFGHRNSLSSVRRSSPSLAIVDKPQKVHGHEMTPAQLWKHAAALVASPTFVGAVQSPIEIQHLNGSVSAEKGYVLNLSTQNDAHEIILNYQASTIGRTSTGSEESGGAADAEGDVDSARESRTIARS